MLVEAVLQVGHGTQEAVLKAVAIDIVYKHHLDDGVCEV
jgi:hypothetical protein